MDTEDLVQEALIGAIQHLPDLREGESERLRKYAQQAIRNRIRDEIRRSRICEVSNEAGHAVVDRGPTPLDDAVAAENRRRLRGALGRLGAEDRALVVGRLELEMSYEELAEATGRPSAAAARMGARRALLRVAQLLDEPPTDG